MLIRPVVASDAQAICDIYNHYVINTAISFEQNPVTATEMVRRIEDIGGKYPWLVAETEAGIVGYAYATVWRGRPAYKHTVESTIYLRADTLRGGIGRPLYTALLEELRARQFHAVVGCIALPNPASVAFHERCGFKKVAHFSEVGRKFEQWLDAGFWEVLLQD
ncbi:arsinothricin resistance N-acetyltransferase ArsN1 family B [Silvimonas iriomotensis]|nr:arsinothricin resistance N-acetyltransferase ArsN1 family B [Silvimonas iriomotensis]